MSETTQQDYAVRMVRREIDESRNAPLQAGMPKATVDCSLLERLCRLAEGGTGKQKRDADRLAALEAAVQELADQTEREADDPNNTIIGEPKDIYHYFVERLRALVEEPS